MGRATDFPRYEFGMREVKRAGKVIASDLLWTPETEAEIRHAFSVANSWRDSHAFPMKSVRASALWHMRHRELIGVTAARLKRMQAIRRKLTRIGLHLNQFQDLGGCRAILASIADVKTLVDIMRASRHDLRAENDYIREPKKDGYRSHHLIFSFIPKSESQKIYDGRRVELQIRTRMQHSWATAVEAVGLMRGEDLKGNKGDLDWLRLFF